MDGTNLKPNIYNIFTTFFDNIEVTRFYNIKKQDRSLSIVYSPQHNSILFEKVQHLIDEDNILLQHYHVDMSQLTSTSTYITICDNTLCTANTVNHSSMGVCAFTANPKHIVLLYRLLNLSKKMLNIEK
ncbi:hypothetical protein RclHR1_34050002 [Rhizophagus clarus]|uniref:Uncharacterized protein n=1 Tax=Rhizophagus clarus TaxID=94130 RepID=A0A2Z6RAC8_9GLOM|nr:hypothetical protein RclHR1_34050002 [Rhizophagus clarus]GES95545.1 hypothetical protein RCL_e15264_RclHR1_34050002 [Rhizophagus clarus]